MITFGTPALLISDNPCLPTGLARMGRDLATLMATMPEFRVAYLGRGIGQRRKLPFPVYDYPETGGWGEGYIEQVWQDHAGIDPGVIITLDDPSRRHWLVNPIGMPESLQKFVQSSGLSFWGYFPLDSCGPDGRSLSTASADCVCRYDRALAASEFGCNVLTASGVKDADWLPHGIFMTKFHPSQARSLVSTDPDKVIVGCVMANQSRKDWPVAFQCFQVLKAKYGSRFRAWVHTDVPIRYWNIYALSYDYGVSDCVDMTQALNDDQMALRYSACACTILPSGGEGFGYPIAESLACGAPCITTNYAGGAELVPAVCRSTPIAYRVDTQHNVLRAVLNGTDFAERAIFQIDAKLEDWDHVSQVTSEGVSHLDWNKLAIQWEKWLRAGL